MNIRIAGQQIQKNIKLNQALQSLFGVGIYRSKRICKKLGCQQNATIFSLKNQQLTQLKENKEQSFLLNNHFRNKIHDEI